MQGEARRGIVAISNLFPNQYEPRRGLFNASQFKSLSSLTPLITVAPVPRFPLGNVLRRFASSGRVGHLPAEDRVDGLDVYYPRYFYPPGLGRPVQGYLYYHGAKAAVVKAAGRVSARALFGTWAYPDGFAVTRFAHDLGVPSVVKVHGSDINDYMESGWRRRVIIDTLNRAGKVIAVSAALKRRLIECGVDETRIDVIYNGVDRDVFQPRDRESAHRRLSLQMTCRRILFVGNLKPVKAVDDVIEAMSRLARSRNDVVLHIIGDGVLRASLKRQAAVLGLGDRVCFEGEKDRAEIATWMNACDVLVLPSLNEGVPNVVLEAMSSGCPVVATNVGGIPEIVTSDEAGLLVEPHSPDELCRALERALAHQWDPDRVAKFAAPYSWPANAQALFDTFEQLADQPHVA